MRVAAAAAEKNAHKAKVFLFSDGFFLSLLWNRFFFHCCKQKCVRFLLDFLHLLLPSWTAMLSVCYLLCHSRKSLYSLPSCCFWFLSARFHFHIHTFHLFNRDYSVGLFVFLCICLPIPLINLRKHSNQIKTKANDFSFRQPTHVRYDRSSGFSLET